MDNNLLITIGLAIAGIGVGVFFKELFNALTSTKLKQEIKELEKDKEQIKEKFIELEEKHERRYDNREKRYTRELTSKTNMIVTLQDEVDRLQESIAKQKTTLNETQKYLWNLLNGTLKNAVINTPLSIDLMRNLKLAFDYLIIENQDKITAVATFPHTGIGRHEWTALEKAGFFKLVNHQDYVLTKEGKDIFIHYKAANPKLESKI